MAPTDAGAMPTQIQSLTRRVSDGSSGGGLYMALPDKSNLTEKEQG